MTVRSSSSLCVRVPKVFNFTFLPVLSVEMSPKINAIRERSPRRTFDLGGGHLLYKSVRGYAALIFVSVFSPRHHFGGTDSP